MTPWWTRLLSAADLWRAPGDVVPQTSHRGRTSIGGLGPPEAIHPSSYGRDPDSSGRPGGSNRGDGGFSPQPVPEEAQKTWDYVWKLCRDAAAGPPTSAYLPYHELMDRQDMLTWENRDEPPPLLQPELLKWRHWKPSKLQELEPIT